MTKYNLYKKTHLTNIACELTELLCSDWLTFLIVTWVVFNELYFDWPSLKLRNDLLF